MTVIKCKNEKSSTLHLLSVGRKVDGGNIGGIFIATVNSESPIGRSKEIFPGDQILEVSGVSITSSDHNSFAEAYRKSASPVQFKVRSKLTLVESLQPAKVCCSKLCASIIIRLLKFEEDITYMFIYVCELWTYGLLCLLL